MKSTRQNIILQIISEQEIETQNQLMDVLAQRGVPSTQATLSRDIKELPSDKNARTEREIPLCCTRGGRISRLR